MPCFPAKQVQAPESEARAVESDSDNEFVADQVGLQLLPVLLFCESGASSQSGNEFETKI